MLQVSSKYTASSPYDKSWNDQAEALRDDDTSDKAAGFVSTQNFLHSPSLSAGVGVVVKASPQCASSCSGSCCSGLQRLMEDTSCCGTSFAVDCTLSLGTAASRPDIPARLSRAGSPAQDNAWPRSARPEQVDAAMRRTCEQDRLEQGISWGGSRGGGDPSPLPEYFSQATGSGRGARGGDGMQRSGSSGWPSFCVQSTKEESGTQAGLLSMLDNHSFDSLPARQSWLPTFMSSNGASAECKNNVRGQDRCLQEGSSMVRVCAHCGTTKTPLWRNGPQGPKSLCNACGIRFKKAGRRSAASASSELQSCSPPLVTTGKVGKRKLEEAVGQEYWVYPEDARPRKRSRGVFLRPTDSLLSGGSCMTWQPCLLTPSPQSSLQRDCHATPLPRNQEKNLVQMGAFSTDEEEGAVLLMALSCGLVHA